MVVQIHNSVPHGCGGKLWNSTPISSPRKWSNTRDIACQLSETLGLALLLIPATMKSLDEKKEAESS